MQLKAFALNDMGRCEDSIEILDRILAQQGNNVHALTAKGHALLGLKHYNESIQYFDDALHIRPEMQEAHVFKGMALYFLGRYDEAMEIEAFRTEFFKRFEQESRKEQPQRKQEE